MFTNKILCENVLLTRTEIDLQPLGLTSLKTTVQKQQKAVIFSCIKNVSICLFVEQTIENKQSSKIIAFIFSYVAIKTDIYANQPQKCFPFLFQKILNLQKLCHIFFICLQIIFIVYYIPFVIVYHLRENWKYQAFLPPKYLSIYLLKTGTFSFIITI